jgi:hypothetical protein
MRAFDRRDPMSVAAPITRALVMCAPSWPAFAFRPRDASERSISRPPLQARGVTNRIEPSDGQHRCALVKSGLLRPGRHGVPTTLVATPRPAAAVTSAPQTRWSHPGGTPHFATRRCPSPASRPDSLQPSTCRRFPALATTFRREPHTSSAGSIEPCQLHIQPAGPPTPLPAPHQRAISPVASPTSSHDCVFAAMADPGPHGPGRGPT